MNRDGILAILERAISFIQNHRTVMMIMAVIVVFITTYILVLPAFT